MVYPVFTRYAYSQVDLPARTSNSSLVSQVRGGTQKVPLIFQIKVILNKKLRRRVSLRVGTRSPFRSTLWSFPQNSPPSNTIFDPHTHAILLYSVQPKKLSQP